MPSYHSRAWRLPLIIVGIVFNLVRVILGYQTHVVSASLPNQVPVFIPSPLSLTPVILYHLDRGRERRKLLRPIDSECTSERYDSV